MKAFRGIKKTVKISTYRKNKGVERVFTPGSKEEEGVGRTGRGKVRVKNRYRNCGYSTRNEVNGSDYLLI